MKKVINFIYVNRLLKILVFCLLANAASSQTYVDILKGSYGGKIQRLQLDSTFLLPTICGTPSGTVSLKSVVINRAALVFDSCGHRGYLWDPSSKIWANIGSDSSVYATLYRLLRDSAILSNKIIDTAAVLRAFINTKQPAGSYAVTTNNLSDLASAATARTNLGLGNLDNTSDANKPVSTAQATAIALKVDKTTTVNGHALSSNVIVSATDITTGTLPDAQLSSNVTKQGNIFNGNNQLLQLDAGGKVPFAQLPATLMIYKGTWDPTTNTPTLANGTGTSGWVYKASWSGGIDSTIRNLGSGNITFYRGDFVIYNGTIWERSAGTDNVLSVSVNGSAAQQGVVSITLPNSSVTNVQLANSSVTIGSTSINLGGTATTIAGLTSVTSTSLVGTLTGNVTAASGTSTFNDINLYPKQQISGTGDPVPFLHNLGGGISEVVWGSGFNYSQSTNTLNVANLNGNAATVTTNANLTGNVTSVGNATTIAAGVVTNAMLAGSIASSKLVGTDITTIGTLSAGAVPYSLLTGTVPTWNQNTTGNASTATLAANSMLWNGYTFNDAIFEPSPGWLLGKSSGSVVKAVSASGLKTFAGYYTSGDNVSFGTGTFAGGVTLNTTNGTAVVFQTASGNTGLVANTFVITGAGSKLDMNTYVYGSASYGIWTGGTKNYTMDGSGNNTWTGSLTGTKVGSATNAAFVASAASTIGFAWNRTDQGTDLKNVDFIFDGTNVSLRSVNDAVSSSTNLFSVVRSTGATTIGNGTGSLTAGVGTFNRTNAGTTLTIDNTTQYTQLDFTHAGVSKTNLYWDNTAGTFNLYTSALAAVWTGANVNFQGGSVTGGAASFTTGAFSGTITSGLTVGSVLSALSATTGELYTYFQNTGGQLYFGLDNSVSSAFGGGNYAANIFASANVNMNFWTNGLRRMTISGSGNVGVGTTSPVGKFVISNGGAAGIEFDPVSGTGGGVDIISYNRSTSAYKPITWVASSYTFNTGAATFASTLTAASIAKTGGTSSQFLMADGSTSTGGGTIVASGTLASQTTGGATVCTYTPAADGMYMVSGVVDMNSGGGTAVVNATWTMPSGTSGNLNLNFGNDHGGTYSIYAKSGTAITITTGIAGTVNFNTNAFIQKLF